jgi:hypothetical protein
MAVLGAGDITTQPFVALKMPAVACWRWLRGSSPLNSRGSHPDPRLFVGVMNNDMRRLAFEFADDLKEANPPLKST